jgi:hypothetical protein
MEDSYRVEVKLYANQKALGPSCVDSPPRKPIGG